VYQIEFALSTEKSLRRLSKTVQQRIFDRLKWLTEHFDETKAEGLSGEFAGLLKLRVGDYRVIYQADRKNKVITVVEIGHRRSVYRKP
jgi:mRNA interferase RelE/StbE